MSPAANALTREEQSVIAHHQAHGFYKPNSYEALTNYLNRVTRPPLNRDAWASSPAQASRGTRSR